MSGDAADGGGGVRTREPISVLLVDDNERWVTFMTEELERTEPSLAVTSALSANEALSVLREERIDCVVVDYQMPEITGIQLLERIREDRPLLPVILVTGEGSEAVATRAIDAGVTDYLPKNPKVDQTPVLTNKIRNAVEQRALRRAIEDGEQRYRTVIEQSRDGIVILRNSRILFCNERFAELTGRDVDELTNTRFVDRFVHDDDRERVRGIGAENLIEGVHHVRLRSEDGTYRHCEYTGRTITYDGSPATMLSIRDVSEKHLEADRYRRERRLNRRVQRALVTSRSREELETAIVTELADRGYDLVWLGTAVDATVQPRVVAGERRYVDEIDRRIDGGAYECEPSVWAARTGTPQVITDLEALFPTDWRDLALECGFRAGIAIPVSYEDVTYGVLAAYQTTAGAIDTAECEFLTELASTVGYAIHHIDARRALTADHGVETRIELGEASHYLSEIAAAGGPDAAPFELVVHSTYADGNDVVQYVTVREGSPERFHDAAADHPAVRDVVPVYATDRASFQLTVAEPTPESTVASFNALVRSTRVTAERAVLRTDLPSRENLRSVIETLEAEFGPASIRSCVEREWTECAREPAVDASSLTEKQAIALEAAYRHGYFERPRRRSATEIADLLGISHSTYLQHLRAAQQKIFSRFYDGAPSDADER